MTRLMCPRRCGKDVRDHHSTDLINSRCDTGPMSFADMRDWFTLRGAGQPGFDTVYTLISEYHGKTEDELNAIYDKMCGPIA